MVGLSSPRDRFTRRIQLVAGGLFVVGYLTYLAAGLYWHVVGDTGAAPIAQYFVTWDMFPGYRSNGQRVVVLGETESGRFVELYPTSRQRRLGLGGALTRLDMQPQPFAGTSGTALEAEVALSVSAQPDDDPIRFVHFVAETWPSKFNMPHWAYERIALAGDPPRDSRTWTTIASRDTRTNPGAGGDR